MTADSNETVQLSSIHTPMVPKAIIIIVVAFYKAIAVAITGIVRNVAEK